MKSPILGQAYTARSKTFACDRMVNFFPEMAPSDSKEPAALYGTPGLELLAQGIAAEVREIYVTSNDICLAVIGNTVYTYASGTLTSIGTINSSSGRIRIRDNGVDAIIVDGVNGYLVSLTTPAVSQITSPNFPNGATAVAYIDTYFITAIPGSQEYVISGQLDGTTWNSLDFASAEGNPDPLVSLIEVNRQLALFGPGSTEFATNSGDIDFPFTRIPGAYLEQGCLAPFSVAVIDNTVLWLGKNDNGANTVFRANGYTPVRISTHAVEYAMSTYSTVSDAFALTYQQEGHAFYCLIFPTEGKTWCYDIATNSWHERASFENGEFVRWRVNCHGYFQGKHLVGDYENGKIYEMSLDVFDEDGAPLKSLRSWRQQHNEKKRVFYSCLELDCETGIGLDGSVQGSDPQWMLRYSNDGGFTWSNEKWKSAGRIGEYSARVRWWRLGEGRDRVWEVSITDPVKRCIVGAYVDAKASSE